MMKKLQILALARLFACAGTNFVQAKVACIKGFEWRHGKCRKKVKAKASSSDSTTSDSSNTAPTPPITSTPPAQPILATPPTQPVILGGNSNTYAPQTFQPDAQFAGQGLVGNYFSSSQTATIHAPSGINSVNYSFENVQSFSGNIIPMGLTYIGSFKTPNWVQPTVYCSGCPNGTNKLYGNLLQNKNSAPATPQAQPVIVDGSSSTYALQTFQPDTQFAGQGLIGKYFSSTQTATIHDPSRINPTNYSFSGVQSMSGNMRPMGLTYIGSFKTPGFVQSKIYCSACPNGTTNLYGNLITNN
jgi:hypothetical protein